MDKEIIPKPSNFSGSFWRWAAQSFYCKYIYFYFWKKKHPSKFGAYFPDHCYTGRITQSIGPFGKIRVGPFHPDSLFTMECVQSHWSGKMDGVMLKPIKKVRAHESDYRIYQFWILPLLCLSTCGLGWVRYMFLDTPWLNQAFSPSFCWSTIHVWLRYIYPNLM